MFTPHPPCCAIPCCKATCEKSGFCDRFGKIGFKIFDTHRAPVMLFAALLSFVCIIFCIVSVCAMSLDAATVKNTCWTRGKTADYEYFIGLEQVVISIGDKDYEYHWDDTDCPSSYCNECKDATASSVSTAIMAVITGLPQLATDIQRSTRKGDLNCQKFMALFTGILGTITTLAALSAYADGCYKELPDRDPNEESIEWSLGPGFVLLMLATILKPVDVILHMLLPVVAEDEEAEKITEKINSNI